MRRRNTRSWLRWRLMAACAAGIITAAFPAVDARQAAAALTVSVTVLDKANVPVTGLSAADITIHEDGTARPVTSVRPADDPIAVAVLLDTAQPPMGSIPPTLDLRRGVLAFIGIVQADHPQSRIALMETGGAAVLTVDFTSKTEDLTRAASRLLQTQRSSIVVLEALADISAAIAEQPSRRRAIVVLDFDTQDTSRQELLSLSARAQRAGVSVWGISVRTSVGSSVRTAGGAPIRETVLEFLAKITGGLRLTAVTATSLEPQFRTIAKALTSQYLVTYQRPADAGPAAEVRATTTRGAKVLTTRMVQ